MLIAVLAFGAGYFAAHDSARVVTLPEVEGIVWPPPPPFEHFELVDTAGRVFDELRLGDKWTLLFFGYTHCPDICPTTLEWRR